MRRLLCIILERHLPHFLVFGVIREVRTDHIQLIRPHVWEVRFSFSLFLCSIHSGVYWLLNWRSFVVVFGRRDLSWDSFSICNYVNPFVMDFLGNNVCSHQSNEVSSKSSSDLEEIACNKCAMWSRLGNRSFNSIVFVDKYECPPKWQWLIKLSRLSLVNRINFVFHREEIISKQLTRNYIIHCQFERAFARISFHWSGVVFVQRSDNKFIKLWRINFSYGPLHSYSTKSVVG